MTVTDIVASTSYHYRLETFTEARRYYWKYVPYTGQLIDGPENGPAPAVWSIAIAPASPFTDCTLLVEVPHTAYLRPCFKCHSTGYVTCWQCRGSTRFRCTACSGRGSTSFGTERQMCFRCGGSGTVACRTCNGTGRVICSQCNAAGQLKFFIELEIKFTNNMDDAVIGQSQLPENLVAASAGDVLFSHEDFRLPPIIGFVEPRVNEASIVLIEKHRTAWPGQRLLRQRHCLRAVPVFDVTATFKERPFTFVVYGNSRDVYAPTYPQARRGAAQRREPILYLRPHRRRCCGCH